MLVRKEGGWGWRTPTLGFVERQEARPGFLLFQLLCDPFLCQPCLCLLASGQLAMAGLAHHRSLPSQEHGWRSGKERAALKLTFLVLPEDWVGGRTPSVYLTLGHDNSCSLGLQRPGFRLLWLHQ